MIANIGMKVAKRCVLLERFFNHSEGGSKLYVLRNLLQLFVDELLKVFLRSNFQLFSRIKDNDMFCAEESIVCERLRDLRSVVVLEDALLKIRRPFQ